MRALHFFRARKPAAGGAEPGGDGGGLAAFASEGQPPDGGQGAGPRPFPLHLQSPVVLGILAALVVLEAVPAALWLKARFAPTTALAAAPSMLPPPPVLTAAVACEPASAPIAPVEPAATATPAPVVAPPPPPPAMVAGMLAVDAPVAMRVFAKGKLIGTTEADTIMLPVGTHELALENEATGYRATRTVSVQAGRTTTVKLEPPSGTVHVNAVPWAEVWIDNRRVGETPIGNLQAPVGQREVVFRHPELGERRATVLVTLKGPARVSMDMRAR